MPIIYQNTYISQGNARSAKGATTSESEVRGDDNDPKGRWTRSEAKSPQGEPRQNEANQSRCKKGRRSSLAPLSEQSELNKGFTLIEMSIVVAVIGLLTGGVLVGKNMYRNAKLQQVSVQAMQMGQAMKNFRDAYNALPGDITNATSYWGSAGGTGADATCFAVNSLTLADPRATCNGDGNGQTFPDGGLTREVFRAVQQMSNAGMLGNLNGRYTGTTGTLNANNGVPGVNLPKGPLPGSAIAPISAGWRAGGASVFFGGPNYGNYVTVSSGGTDRVATGPIISSKEVLSIDQKMDDSNPGTGQVVVGRPNVCTNAPTIASFNYATPEAFPTLAYLQEDGINCFRDIP